jgi:DNA-binding response OmpR family regulator
MATDRSAVPPLVLLVSPENAKHHHQEVLTNAGFRVAAVPRQDVDDTQIRDIQPDIIAIELDEGHSSDALDLARGLRAEAGTHAIFVPVIVYGLGLNATAIEEAARGGALWLQLEPADGAKLVAAIRGVLSAAGIAVKKQ